MDDPDEQDVNPTMRAVFDTLLTPDLIEACRDALAKGRVAPSVVEFDHDEDKHGYGLLLDRLDSDEQSIRDVEDLVELRLRDAFGIASPLTAEDFTDAMFHQLGGRELESDFRENYLRSLLFAFNSLSPLRAADRAGFSLDFGTYSAHDEVAEYEPIQIWQHANNFRLEVCFERSRDQDSDDLFHGWLQLRGWASEGAFSQLKKWLQEWTSTIRQIIHYSAISSERKLEGEEWLPFACVKANHLSSGDGKTILKVCLNALLRSTSRDSLENRLVNAITLFREAARQELPAVGLTLCFSAIEALVSKKGAVSEQVPSHVPALLCPIDDPMIDPRENDAEPALRGLKRREDAARAIKNLYDVRSLLAHGGSVDASNELFEYTKTMTAGVIRGLCCWIEHCEMSGHGTQQHRDFITELYVCANKDQTMVGVPDLTDLLPLNSAVKKLHKA